ncbi:uncharacterized protein LOC141614541 [Silene latifolia]|uniref:uncharacterized protein LOC141614541 n=1 Tax=Silene latifolia TaxID=37657 RepID=UPI003D778636
MATRGTSKDRTRINDRGREFCRKTLWHLPLPMVWKILLWKIIVKALPTGSEFLQRKLDVDPYCRMCGGDQKCIEIVEHLFRDCSLTRRLWAGSTLGIRVDSAAVREKIHMLCNSSPTKQPLSLLQTSEEGSSYEEREAIRNGYPVRLIGNHSNCAVVRVKVDASWVRGLDAAVGWIAFDHTGQELERGMVRSRAESAMQAEALGVREVLVWAQERRFLHIDLSSDCLQLINQIAGLEKEDHLIAGILADLRDRFIQQRDIVYVSGTFNKTPYLVGASVLYS